VLLLLQQLTLPRYLLPLLLHSTVIAAAGDALVMHW
jgi:hypothetical protein